MKRLLLPFVSLILTFSVLPSNAQDPALTAAEVAARAAAQDADIVGKVDAATGEVNYFRKSICPSTGKTIYTAVEFCTKSGQFVNLASTDKVHCNKATEKPSVGKAPPVMTAAFPTTPAAGAARRAACAAACGKVKTSAVTSAKQESNN